MSEPVKREGMQYLGEMSASHGAIVAITEHKGRVIIAAQYGVFVKGDDDVFRELLFVPHQPTEETNEQA